MLLTAETHEPITREPTTRELSEFSQNAPAHLAELAESGRVQILTVNGEAKGVVMSPAAYDRMAEQVERAEITAALRRGFADIDAGRVKPAEQAIRDIALKLGLDMSVVEGE